ncbi:MAG TPA: PEGA domain-containing protein [Spirochaetia bacterium]|nr:PEGA domain-containing protein [Spirochaetia bacterium]
MNAGHRGLRTGWIALALLLVSMSAHSGELVFVSSEPFAARILVDGNELAELTPAVISLAQGTYSITLSRDGHETRSTSLVVEAGKVNELSMELPARYILLETPETPADRLIALPVGGYDVERSGRGFAIRPVYPRENRVAFAQTVVPIAVVVASVLSGWAYVAPPAEPRAVVVPSLVAQLTAGVAIVYAGHLMVERHEYLAAWSPPREPYQKDAAAASLELAERSLERGDLAAASQELERLVDTHPHAPGVPEALYTLGRLESSGGNPNKATEYFRRIMDDYPVVAYYDRTLVQLARISFGLGDDDAAERYLDRVTFGHPSVTRESVEVLRGMSDR